MALLDRLIGLARGAETLFQISRKKAAEDRRAVRFAPGHVRALILMREISEAETEGERAVHANDPAKLIEKFRLAVRRQAHHFVFVAEFPEAEVLRERRIVHSERVRKPDISEDVHPRPRARRPHGAREIAKAIRRKNGGALKRRNKISAREMRRMVLDSMEARANFPGRHCERRRQIFPDAG